MRDFFSHQTKGDRETPPRTPSSRVTSTFHLPLRTLYSYTPIVLRCRGYGDGLPERRRTLPDTGGRRSHTTRVPVVEVCQRPRRVGPRREVVVPWTPGPRIQNTLNGCRACRKTSGGVFLGLSGGQEVDRCKMRSPLVPCVCSGTRCADHVPLHRHSGARSLRCLGGAGYLEGAPLGARDEGDPDLGCVGRGEMRRIRLDRRGVLWVDGDL